MTHPLVYEINTRCWLHELSQREGKAIRLGNVSDVELDTLAGHGFTHLWLMGVWRTGPLSRAATLQHPAVRRACREVLPSCEPHDMGGSPYAVAAYQVSRELGGNRGLASLRQRLAQRGLKLILDFVPNHLGLDHAWLREHPEWFVQAPRSVPGAFPLAAREPVRWVAHGRDPYFAPWTDTAQLDYRLAEVRAAITAEMVQVAGWCDGLRCDMAMLLLESVFNKTWAEWPGPSAGAEGEFWEAALAAVKQHHPECLLLAEVYWGLEVRLQQLGFDYTYDKALHDALFSRDPAAVHRHLTAQSPGVLHHSLHFLENHDELRIAPRLPLPAHRAAALLILGLPGMRLLHEGQLDGHRIRHPVELLRRVFEPPRLDLASMYQALLEHLGGTGARRGSGRLLSNHAAWAGNSTWEAIVAVQWRATPGQFELVVVNWAPHRSQGYVRLEIPELAETKWRMVDLLGDERYERDGSDLAVRGLYLDTEAHAAHLYRFTAL